MKMPIYAYKMAQDDLLYRKVATGVSSPELHCRWRSVATQMESVFYTALFVLVAAVTCDANGYKPSKPGKYTKMTCNVQGGPKNGLFFESLILPYVLT